MSAWAHTERAFEDRVEYELLRRGWDVATGLYSAEMGIHTGALWEFIGKTQIKRWDKLLELHGGDQDTAMRQFALRVAAEIDSRGVLDVLRQGVKDRGVQIDLAHFRPGHTLAAGALDEYRANVLGVAAAPLQFPRSQPVGGPGVLCQRASRGDCGAQESEYRAERRPRHRPVP
jgi:type I restriction enzyme, R subunit